MAEFGILCHQHRHFLSESLLPLGIAVNIFNNKLKIKLVTKMFKCILHILAKMAAGATVESQDYGVGRAIPAHATPVVSDIRITPAP